jgi:methyl-accepting chemotaxis protein
MMVPIINPDTNEVVGGVGCLLDMAAIQPLLEDTINSYHEIAMMIIYSNNGFILGHFIPDRIGKMLPDVDKEYGNNIQAAYQSVLEGRPFQASTYDPTLETNIQFLLIPCQIGNSDQYWTIVVGTTHEYILTEVKALTEFTIVLALIAIAAAAVIVYLVLHHTTKPVIKVAHTLKDISEGEGDLTKTISVNTKDEIGELAHYFNQTLEKIKNLVITIKKQTDALFDVGDNLASHMNETAAAINEITANTQSIKGKVINQSASVTETNVTMENITHNIGKLNQHIEKQTSSVSESSSAIEEMLANIASVTQTLIKNSENVKELSSASGIGRLSLREVADDLQGIVQESEGLMQINSVMKKIASQTSLLSMNAAIEAAHAGESGKGFAVVADEIRKLAEESSVQSKSISTVLKKIKESIDKITSSTDKVLKKFEIIDDGLKAVSDQEVSIGNAMEEQGTGSKQILDAISRLNDITQEVKRSSIEMLAGSNEIIREGKNLDQVTEEIAGGMNEMAIGADEINAAVNEVNQITVRNKDHIEHLVEEVSRFKVE